MNFIKSYKRIFFLFSKTHWLYSPLLIASVFITYVAYTCIFWDNYFSEKDFTLESFRQFGIIIFHYFIIIFSHLFVLPLVYLHDYTERLSQGEQRYICYPISFITMFSERYFFILFCLLFYFVFSSTIYLVFFIIKEGFVWYIMEKYFFISAYIFVSFWGYLAFITLLSFLFRSLYYGILQIIASIIFIGTSIDILPFTFGFSLLRNAITIKNTIFSPNILIYYTSLSFIFLVVVYIIVSISEKDFFQNYLKKS